MLSALGFLDCLKSCFEQAVLALDTGFALELGQAGRLTKSRGFSKASCPNFLLSLVLPDADHSCFTGGIVAGTTLGRLLKGFSHFFFTQMKTKWTLIGHDIKISLFRKPQLLQGVYAMGFNRPSKIQENALPMMLAEPYVHILPTRTEGFERFSVLLLNFGWEEGDGETLRVWRKVSHATVFLWLLTM